MTKEQEISEHLHSAWCKCYPNQSKLMTAPSPQAQLKLYPLQRAAWLLLSLGCTTVIVTARLLEPSRRGYGTHTQLGLAPCSLRQLTGIPCGGCGLTTSFAHTAHLELTQAFAAHPMGPLLFVCCSLASLLGAIAAVRPHGMCHLLARLRVAEGALALSLGMLLVWLSRIGAALLR